MRHLRRPGGEFLAQGHRHRIHQMGAADLDDVAPLRRPPLQRAAQHAERRDQPLRHRLGGGDVHHGGEAVVGRLAAIDVVVRMHRLAGAKRLAQQLIGAVRDDLVGVHVGLGAAAGLPDGQREIGVAQAFRHLGGGAGDGFGQLRRQLAQRLVGLGRRLLLQADGADQDARETLRADAEQAAGALGLRAPVASRLDLDGAEAVGLDAVVGVGGCGHGGAPA
ncbi:hypothetical protein QE401_002402 [Pseudoroseomonas cervicalis]|nr:hypothetical protein [Pseudoroseomonas cervicalis]